MRAALLFILSYPLFADDLINLEHEYHSPFVLNTKRIVVPGFEDAYNPSLLEWGDGFLLSFRTGDRAQCSADLIAASFMDNCVKREENQNCFERWRTFARNFNCKNQIGLAWFDAQLNIVGNPQLLYIHYPRPLVAERQHDPRLIRVDGNVYLVYSNMITGYKKPEIRRPFITQLHYEDDVFVASPPIPIVRYEGAKPGEWSKNWVPFDYQGALYLSHHINPHVVFRYDGTIACSSVAKSENVVDWAFGDLRGGTPAILDNDGQYLALFHSSINMKSAHSNDKMMPHYFMGAYTFEGEPPFRLTAISSFPIVAQGFYDGPEYRTWKPLRVVFPGGLVVKEEIALVAYGRQDHEIWIATIDKASLKQSLTPL